MGRGQDCYVTETFGTSARIPSICRNLTMKLAANLESRQESRQCVGIQSLRLMGSRNYVTLDAEKQMECSQIEDH